MSDREPTVIKLGKRTKTVPYRLGVDDEEDRRHSREFDRHCNGGECD